MFKPLRVSRRREPTLHDKLVSHCEDIRVSSYGEALSFILIVDTDERFRVMTCGYTERSKVVEHLCDAIRHVRNPDGPR